MASGNGGNWSLQMFEPLTKKTSCNGYKHWLSHLSIYIWTPWDCSFIPSRSVLRPLIIAQQCAAYIWICLAKKQKLSIVLYWCDRLQTAQTDRLVGWKISAGVSLIRQQLAVTGRIVANRSSPTSNLPRWWLPGGLDVFCVEVLVSGIECHCVLCSMMLKVDISYNLGIFGCILIYHLLSQCLPL